MALFRKVLPLGVAPDAPLLISVYLGFSFLRGSDLILCLFLGSLWDVLSGYPFGMHMGLGLFAFIFTYLLKTQFMLETPLSRLLCLAGVNAATLLLFVALLLVFPVSSATVPYVLKLALPQIGINLAGGIFIYPIFDRAGREKSARNNLDL
jgi:cell shape-determining protein MreD